MQWSNLRLELLNLYIVYNATNLHFIFSLVIIVVWAQKVRYLYRVGGSKDLLDVMDGCIGSRRRGVTLRIQSIHLGDFGVAAS